MAIHPGRWVPVRAEPADADECPWPGAEIAPGHGVRRQGAVTVTSAVG